MEYNTISSLDYEVKYSRNRYALKMFMVVGGVYIAEDGTKTNILLNFGSSRGSKKLIDPITQLCYGHYGECWDKSTGRYIPSKFLVGYAPEFDLCYTWMQVAEAAISKMKYDLRGMVEKYNWINKYYTGTNIANEKIAHDNYKLYNEICNIVKSYSLEDQIEWFRHKALEKYQNDYKQYIKEPYYNTHMGRIPHTEPEYPSGPLERGWLFSIEKHLSPPSPKPKMAPEIDSKFNQTYRIN